MSVFLMAEWQQWGMMMLLVESSSATNGDGDVTVRSLHSCASIDELIVLFTRISVEEGWQPDGQLPLYRNRSAYFGLQHLCGRLIGGLQLVMPDASGTIPSQGVWPEVLVAPAAAHIAVLAVEHDWRGKRGGLFWLLAVEMWRHCVLSGVKELWLEATPRTMRCYQRLGWPLRIRGDLRMHWGEECYLCSLDVREVAGSLAERALRSPVYRSLIALAVAAPSEKV